MDIPQMEKMSKEDIIGYMRNCAKQYVPEWRYDEEQPDRAGIHICRPDA